MGVKEIGLYYLQSRYYNPTTGRFINADLVDTLISTIGDITDKNLFNYCDNNPVMRIDGGGEFWKEIGLAVAITAGVLAVGALAVATGGLATVVVAGSSSMLVATPTAVSAVEIAMVASTVACGGIAVHTAAALTEGSISKSKSESDPYARPGQKKQGRERKNKARQHDNWKPRSKPKVPKKHTPGRDHRKW